MKLKNQDIRMDTSDTNSSRRSVNRTGERLGVFGIVIAVIYWVLESAIDAYIFQKGTFAGRIIPPDPNELWMRILIASLLIAFGFYAQAVIRAKAGMEKSLREERNLMTSILDTVAALVVVLDSDGRIVNFNRACEEATGYTFGEVRGVHFWDRFLTEEEKEPVREVFNKLKAGAFPSTFENNILTKHGEKRLISWSNTVLPGHDGQVKFVIGTGIDITERKQMESERKFMLSMFAHDLKNPIITSSGFLSRLLSGKAGPIDEKQLNYLQILKEQFDVLERLVTNFLEFTRYEAGKYEPEKVPVDIKMAMYRNIEISKMEAEKKDIKILLDIPENIPDTIGADSVLMDRVFSNLLGNAVKFTPRGGTVSVSLSSGNGHILFRVSDTGIGIPVKDLPHIFNPFFRGEKDSKGSGLGLAIVKRIIESHGGKIWVESEQGKGSAFIIMLPK
jgi:PAS domain S-box-containing protein